MAQPATSLPAFEFAPLDDGDAPQPSVRHGGIEGPANRALAELSLALSSETHSDADDRWKAGKSLRFVFITCGLFWLTAIALYAFH